MESSESVISEESVKADDSENKLRLMAGAAVLGLSGISAIIAGLATSRTAKKRNIEFLREVGKNPLTEIKETPYSLAFKALALGTVWAVGGYSLIIFGFWKFYGIKSFEEFKMRMKKNMKKSPPSSERTEFESLSDLINYLTKSSKPDENVKDNSQV